MYLTSFFLFCVLACSSGQYASFFPRFYISYPEDKATSAEAIEKCLSHNMVPADYADLLDVKNKGVDIDWYLQLGDQNETSQNFWINPYATNGDLAYWKNKLSDYPKRIKCTKMTYHSGVPYELNDEYCSWRYRYLCRSVSKESLRTKLKDKYDEMKKWLKEKLKKAGNYTEDKFSKLMYLTHKAFHDLKGTIGNVVEFSKEQAELFLGNILKKSEELDKRGQS